MLGFGLRTGIDTSLTIIPLTETRDGEEIKVSIPSDCLGIQVGECLQIVSGGLLVATPHCVRGCKQTSGLFY